jgi:hypothetical protein
MSILHRFGQSPQRFISTVPLDLSALLIARRLGDAVNAEQYRKLLEEQSMPVVLSTVRQLISQGAPPEEGFYIRLRNSLRKEDNE